MCLRNILRIPYTDHVTNATVRLQAGSPPQLSQLIQARRLRFFGQVARMDMSLDITRALKVSIRGMLKDWRLPPGRPRHTWLRTLEADLQPLNLGNTLRIENIGSTLWKPLRCSSGLLVMMVSETTMGDNTKHTYAIATDLRVGITQRSIGLRLRHWTLCTGASNQYCQEK